MSKTVYIARDAQILGSAGDEPIDPAVLDRVKLSVTALHDFSGVSETDRAAIAAFATFVDELMPDSRFFEFLRSTGPMHYPGEEDEFEWTVEVLECSVNDFSGDLYADLVAHEDTVRLGYAVFVDQSMKYVDKLLALEDIAKSSESEVTVRSAVNNVYDEAREHNDPLADIVDALVGTGWEYDRSVGELSRRAEAA